MAAERLPVDKMETRKGDFAEQKKLVEQLLGIVNEAKQMVDSNTSARNFRELTVNTSESVLGVTLDKYKAKPGNYQIEVVQLAQKSSAMSNGFEDPDDSYVGVGFIQYSLPDGSSRDVYIDSDHSSLKGIAELINADESNGLSATVVNDGTDSETPWHLILSLEETGAKNFAEFPYFYFVDGEDDFYLESQRGAQNAKIKVDGFLVEVPSNKVDSVIPGVTLDLKRAKPGEEIPLEIKEDKEAIIGKVQDLIEKVNAILKFINEQNKMDDKTNTKRTLGGEITLQSLEGRLRSTIFRDVYTGLGPRRLGSIGITFQRDGLLKFDQKVFDSKIANNFQLVSDIIVGFVDENKIKKDGFLDYLNKVLSDAVRLPDGILHSRKRTIQNRIDQIDRQIERKERMLETREQNLKNKFARLEGTISRIKGQGAGLSALGAQAGNPVSQLGATV